MFGRKDKKESAQIDNAVAKSINYEVSIADIARRSEKRAWMVAFASILMSLILAGGYFFMLPMKKLVPILVMADAYTGTATVATLRGDFNKNSITTNEAINKSNVAHYIMAREAYDFSTLGSQNWKRVHAMSTREVGSGYTAIHDNNNPNQPFKTYGRERAIRIEILSLQLSQGGSAEKPVRTATVRFQRNIYDKKSGRTTLLDNKIATLEYTYNFNLTMDEKERIDNPLGFQVTQYRVDNDYSGSSPVATPAVAQAIASSDPGVSPYGQGYPAVAPGQQQATGQPMPPGAQPYATPPAPNFDQPPVGVPVQQPQNPSAPASAPAGQTQPPTGPAPNQVNGVGN